MLGQKRRTTTAKEYIEREQAIRKIKWASCEEEAVMGVRRIPAADVVEVKHGEWISDDADILFHCSECETQVSTSWDYESDWGYCPNCGARMDGERKDLKGERNGDKH